MCYFEAAILVKFLWVLFFVEAVFRVYLKIFIQSNHENNVNYFDLFYTVTGGGNHYIPYLLSEGGYQTSVKYPSFHGIHMILSYI